MVGSRTIKAGTEQLLAEDVTRLLERFAHRVYADRYQEELASLLEQDMGITRTGLTLEEFFQVNVGSGKIIAGYSGPCKDSNEALQRKAIDDMTRGWSELVGGVVHGATMWGFIKEAHLSAARNNMLSIGVMPWQGVSDLMSISDRLGDDFPKMDYLAISGETYKDHPNILARRLDYLMLLGGRSGALAEANSAKQFKKPVITLVLENEKDLAFQNFQGGSWYTDDYQEAVKFVKYNLTPNQKLFNGAHVSVHDFDKRTIDKIRLTFLGNSGRKSDLYRHGQILDRLLMSISPSLSPKIEGVSGATYLGGVQAFYDSCTKAHISRSGIMSRKGIGYRLADVDYLVAHGSEWGSESKVTSRMSDIAIVLGGGDQTGSEVRMLATTGGRAGTGVPVIVIDDPIIGNWSSQRSLDHPNVHYFSSGQLSEAAKNLNTFLTRINKERYNLSG